MPTVPEMLTEAIATALAESHASSPTYDADTLAGNIVTAIDAASLDVTQRAAPEATDIADGTADDHADAIAREQADTSGRGWGSLP